MSTNADTVRLLADVESLKLKFPNATISRETGFSAGDVSNYLSGKREPSKRFLEAFYNAFGKKLGKVVIRKEAEKGNRILDADKIIVLDASVAVLISEIASLKALMNNSVAEVEKMRLVKAIQDVAGLL